MKTVATHNGTFHADDVFAAATLALVYAAQLTFVRTREAQIIAEADFVVDVGGVYDEQKDRFDHHQGNFKLKRSGGVPYASFGLVWKKYGLVLCGSQMVADDIDKELVQPIDAEDNGIHVAHVRKGMPYPFTLAGLINVYNATWKEDDTHSDEIFLRLVDLAKDILRRMIARSRDKHESDRFVRTAYEEAQDKRIVVLDGYYPAREVLSQYPEPLYVVRKHRTGESWTVETVKDDPRSFESRKNFPKSWGAKSNAELVKVTGVSDAMFCHKGLFLAMARSREGAIKLAELAVML